MDRQVDLLALPAFASPPPLLSGATVAMKGLREKTQSPLASGEPDDAPIQSPLYRPGAGAPQPLRLAVSRASAATVSENPDPRSPVRLFGAECGGRKEAWTEPALTPPLSHISRLAGPRPWLLTDTY